METNTVVNLMAALLSALYESTVRLRRHVTVRNSATKIRRRECDRDSYLTV